MNARRSHSAGVAGLCFLACIAIVAVAYVTHLLRVYGPVLREWIHWALTPQFVLGMLFMAFCTALCALAIARSNP